MSFSSKTTDYKVINVQQHLCSTSATEDRPPLTSYTLRSVNSNTSPTITCKCPKTPRSVQLVDSDQSCLCPNYWFPLFLFTGTWRSYLLGHKAPQKCLKALKAPAPTSFTPRDLGNVPFVFQNLKSTLMNDLDPSITCAHPAESREGPIPFCSSRTVTAGATG
jgi:hypothetical protein